MKKRLVLLLTERNLAPSREKAKALYQSDPVKTVSTKMKTLQETIRKTNS